MSKAISITGITCLLAACGTLHADIYRDGWVDRNKNGTMDPYENPALSMDERVEDLLRRMTMEEKTCQMATIYGYKRVSLKPGETRTVRFALNPKRDLRMLNRENEWGVEPGRVDVRIGTSSAADGVKQEGSFALCAD